MRTRSPYRPHRKFRGTPLKGGIACLLFSLALLSPAAAEERLSLAMVNRDDGRQKPRAVLAPRVKESCECYDITGKDENELRDQMTQNGHSLHDGRKYHAVTAWRLTWDYERREADGTCSAETFLPTVDISIRYPRWSGRADAPLTLGQKWDAYIESLTRHEEGHRDLVVEAVAGLSRAVAALPPARTCDELDRQVRRLCRMHMQRLQKDSDAYDEGTVHGLAQGAVFP